MTQPQRSRRPSPARPAEPEPSLGQVGFDQWFATPVFESDPEERLEEMATSRRGPLRLAASAFLRLDARAARMRHRSDPPAGAPTPEVLSYPGGEAGPDPDPVLSSAPAEPDPAPEPETPAVLSGGPAEPDPVPELEIPAGAGRVTLRQRLSAALDRWADRELAAQARLEQVVLPRRWQS